jgi:hypothetical protein
VIEASCGSGHQGLTCGARAKLICHQRGREREPKTLHSDTRESARRWEPSPDENATTTSTISQTHVRGSFIDLSALR